MVSLALACVSFAPAGVSFALAGACFAVAFPDGACAATRPAINRTSAHVIDWTNRTDRTGRTTMSPPQTEFSRRDYAFAFGGEFLKILFTAVLMLLSRFSGLAWGSASLTPIPRQTTCPFLASARSMTSVPTRMSRTCVLVVPPPQPPPYPQPYGP